MNEKEEAAELRARINDEKIQGYNSMLIYLKMGPTELKHCGHSSIGGALEFTLKYHEERVQKLIREHISKYPD